MADKAGAAGGGGPGGRAKAPRTTAPGPRHRLTEAEALACLAGADHAALLATAAEAIAVARKAPDDDAARIAGRNALLLAAAALHLVLWGPPQAPGEAVQQ